MEGNYLDIIKQKIQYKGIDFAACGVFSKKIITDYATAANMYYQAHNEFWYLVSDVPAYGTIISSDTGLLNVNDALMSDMETTAIIEFTGNIEISLPSTPNKQLFEFIRIIPPIPTRQ